MKKKNDVKYINKSLVIKDLVEYIDMDDEVESKNLIKQHNIDINEVYNQVTYKDLLIKYFSKTKYIELSKKNIKKDICHLKYSVIEIMFPTLTSLILLPLSYYAYLKEIDLNFNLLLLFSLFSVASFAVCLMNLKKYFLELKRKKLDYQYFIDNETSTNK